MAAPRILFRSFLPFERGLVLQHIPALADKYNLMVWRLLLDEERRGFNISSAKNSSRSAFQIASLGGALRISRLLAGTGKKGGG